MLNQRKSKPFIFIKKNHFLVENYDNLLNMQKIPTDLWFTIVYKFVYIHIQVDAIHY